MNYALLVKKQGLKKFRNYRATEQDQRVTWHFQAPFHILVVLGSVVNGGKSYDETITD